MWPEDGTHLVWLVVLMLIVGVIGIGVILALMSSWRNQARRDRLLEQGRRLRATQPGGRQPYTGDAWREAGQRYRDPDTAPDTDADPRRDDPPPRP
ncbi:MAG: hypothetical protein WD534_10500 [Phycisphaeraceae bacterium]